MLRFGLTLAGLVIVLTVALIVESLTESTWVAGSAALVAGLVLLLLRMLA